MYPGTIVTWHDSSVVQPTTVETVDNSVIELEEKQIAYQSEMLDMQMLNMAQPQMPLQQPQQGSEEGIESMQNQPNKRATAIANPRPNTLSVIQGERNLV